MKRYILFAIYYVVAISIVIYCGIYFKTGPCTPNLDILSWIVFSFIGIILFVREILLYGFRKKIDVVSTIINFVGLCILFALGFIKR
jgi:hypothetical protein